MRSVVPSLRYMCHLWPYRAVERYSEFGVRTGDRAPAHPVLVLGNDLNPLSQEAHSISVLRQLWKAEGSDQFDSASNVMQAQFLVRPNFAPFARLRASSDDVNDTM